MTKLYFLNKSFTDYLLINAMTKSIKFLCMMITLFSLNLAAFANQNNLREGWENVKNNAWAEARENFKAAAKDDKTAAEAYLGLSLLASVDKPSKEAFDYFLEFYEAHPNPYPYIFALWLTPSIVKDFERKTDDQLDFFKELADDPKANGTLIADANEILGRSYDKINKRKKAVKFYSRIGTILEWQIIGEFENISASGFDKDWPPLYHPESNAVMTSKRGADIKWFEVPEYRPGHWINFSCHFHYTNSIVFAQTFCKSPTDTIVQLRIGTSGSLKAWINDKTAISVEEERNNGLDTYIAEIKLNKGFNRILLQLGESEAGDLNFLCRITDENGFNIHGLEFRSKYDPSSTVYDKNYNYESKTISIFAEKFFEEKIKKNSDKLLNYILLAETYMRNDKTTKARNTLEKAQELAPDCSYTLLQLIQVYMRDKNRTSLSLAMERFKKIDPDNPYTLDNKFDEAVDKEDYEEAKSILNKLEDNWGKKHKKILLKKLRLAAEEKKNEEFMELTETAYKQYPNDYSFVSTMYYLEKRKNNTKKAESILEDFVEDNFNSSAIGLLSDHYFDIGDPEKGFELLELRLEDSPAAVGWYEEIGNNYFNQRDYEKAKEFYDKCLQIAPYVGAYHGKMGQIYKEMGKKEQAVESYENCIVYDPTKYDIRKKLRELQNEKSVFEYFEEPDLYKLYENAPIAENYTDDNSVIILDETQRVIYDGASEQKCYMLAKVFNSAGVDEWKEYYIPYTNNQRFDIEKAEVLKKDGNRLKAEKSRNQVVFTNLEEGDAILLIYKLKDYDYGKLSHHFWGKQYFTHYFAYEKTSYSLLVDPDREFKHVVVNSNMKPEIEDVGEFKKYTWEKEDQPGVKYEAYMPPLSDIGEVLHYSSMPDWDFVSKWYSDLSKSKAKSDPEVKEIAKELFKENDNISEREKVKEIYDYIVKNIRYSHVSFRQSGLIPQKASKTINTKMGDCKDVSTLFVSLCKEANIDANLVLVDSRKYGKKSMVLPTIDFDHCIVNVNAGGDEYFVELTNDYNPFSTLYYGLKNSFALQIKDDKSISVKPEYLDPPTRVENSVYRISEIKFDGNDMDVTKNTVKIGGKASSMRSYYRSEGKQEQEKNMQQAVSGDYPNVELTKLEFDDNLNKTDDSLSYVYGYKVKNVFNEIAGLYIFKPPWADAEKPVEFIDNKNRKYPLSLWQYSSTDTEKEILTIEIPDDKVVAEIPEPVNISCMAAEYSMNYRREGNKLIATRILTFKNDYVPLEKYDEFSDFFEQVITADSKQIAFKDKR